MKRILLAGLLLINISARADANIEYRQAQESDIPGVLDVIKEASKYPDKILVPPVGCQKAFVEEMITKKRLFIAVKKENGEVIATNKLFVVVAEGDEKKSSWKIFFILREKGHPPTGEK